MTNNVKKILVVDDYELNLNIVEEFIGDESRELYFARNGKQAIELFKQNQDIKIILMDIKMPILNGIEATNEIRKFNKDVIIIAQTAYAMNYEKQKILNAGFNDYITKPIIDVDLINIINKY